MIFKNKENKVRSGWKILLTFLVGFGMVFFCTIFIGMVAGVVIGSKGISPVSSQFQTEIEKMLASESFMIMSGCIQNICLIVSCIIFWKVFEKKKIAKMGLLNIKDGYKELILGLAFGAISISLVAILLLAFGTVKFVTPITKPEFSVSLIKGLVLFIFVGFGEEILGRGYIVSVLKQTKNKWAVIIISSVIFAALHLSNQAVSILAMINLFLVGALFAYMFMKSKNIWLPIGYHITWNYFQGYIWGFEVSGMEVNGLYKLERTTDNIVNGGAFGAEGGLIVTAIILISFVVIAKYYKNSTMDNFMEEKEEDSKVVEEIASN